MRVLVCLALAVLVAPLAAAQTPSPGDVVINEIAYDPPSPQASSNEWIEVVNRSAEAVDLAGLIVSDAAGASEALAGPLLIQPGEFAVFVRNEAEFAAAFPSVAFTALASFPSLNNTGDRVAISIGATELDAVPYVRAWGGDDASLERRDPDGPSADASNWTTSSDPDSGTPGEQNTAFELDETPPSLLSAVAENATLVTVTFSEPLDLVTAEDEANYSISDGLGQPAMAEVFDDDPALVRLTLSTPIPGLGTYTLTVSGLADRAGNVMDPETVSFAFGEGAVPEPRDVVLNEFLYDEPTSDNPGEFVELFNRTGETFDLADFTLNDGTGEDEPITTQQTLLGPDGYAVIVEDGDLFSAIFPSVPFIEQPVWGALNNSGDAITLKYQGVVIDSLFYSPDWGGEDTSLERKDPRGPSSSASNWATTTDLRGGTPGAINTQFAPDTQGPEIEAVQVAASEAELLVTLDEPVASASVSASAFSVTGATVVSAVLDDEAAVRLGLSARLPGGEIAVTATGLTDPLGNTTPTTTFSFLFEPDVTPPAIATASATTDRIVRVVFTEAVQVKTASDPGTYSLEGVPPDRVLLRRDGDGPDGTFDAADLVFSPEPPQRQALPLIASGLVDLAGNVRDETRAIVFFGDPDPATPGALAITEILYDPASGSAGEYVEVLNTTADQILDLASLILADDLADDAAIADRPIILGPGQYLALVADLPTFRAQFPDAPATEVARFPGLGNSGDLVALLDALGTVIDSVRYDPDWHRVELEDATGVSLERRNTSLGANDPNNWSSSLDVRGGTPGAANSISTDSPPPTTEAGLSFFPDPFDAGNGQGTTISYVLESPAALLRVRIFDGAGRQVRELEAARLSGSEGTLIWDGRDDRGEQLRIGPYIVLLEAVDTEGGTTEAVKGVVVLARQL
ncbi:MAG: lamin tail domain-containing protein [Bacteroidota bacterium]